MVRMRRTAVRPGPTIAVNGVGSLGEIRQGMLDRIEDGAVKTVDLFIDFDPLDPERLCVRDQFVREFID